MRKKGSAPTSAATLAGAAETAISCNHCTTAAAGRQWKITDFLGRSRGSATTCRELCALTGLDNRTCRKLIEQERRRGVPILSDCEHGYWLSSSKSEIEKFYMSMKSRAFEIERVANCVLLATLEATDD